MPNKMLIDATHPEETRVVVVRGNRVEEFDFETANRKPLRGNIYLAKVTRVEPSLQAAFVEYGGNRHGFLAFSEIHPDYYQIPVADRQALIEADARAARDDDEADDHHRGSNRGNRGRNRHRERPHARRDETVSSAPLAAAELAPDAAEIPAGVAGEPLPGGPYSSDQPSTEPPHDELDHEADAPEHQSSESVPADQSGEHHVSAEGGEQPAHEANGNGANVQENVQEHSQEE